MGANGRVSQTKSKFPLARCQGAGVMEPSAANPSGVSTNTAVDELVTPRATRGARCDPERMGCLFPLPARNPRIMGVVSGTPYGKAAESRVRFEAWVDVPHG